jgi:hypothetical protein
MSTAGRDQAPATSPSDVAGALEGADFVRLVARADGDALAATGLLADALGARSVPYQASVARSVEDGHRATDADVTVSVGASGVDATHTLADEPLSATAVETVRALGGDPDLALALAGTTVAGGTAGGTVAEEAGFERRPGVAVPVADYTDGLAHSTLLHAPFSGERAAVEDALGDLATDDLDDDAHRKVASLVALTIAGDETASERATEAIERALHPYVGGPFETIGGYGDVLDAVARERPGLGVALALGHDGAREQALEAWRTRASRAHTGIRTAATERYDGLFVVRGDALPVGTVARLVARYRSPEPVALVLGDGAAAIRTTDDRDVATALEAGVTAVGGAATGYRTRGHARFDGEAADLVETVREAL